MALATCPCQNNKAKATRTLTYSTDVFVRDDFDILHMACGLKDLFENVFCHPRIQSSHVQGSLIWLRGSTAHEAPRAGRWGHHATRVFAGRCKRGGDRIVVLWDDHRWQGRRRHVCGIALTVCRGAGVGFLPWSARESGWRRKRHGKGRRQAICVRHHDDAMEVNDRSRVAPIRFLPFQSVLRRGYECFSSLLIFLDDDLGT